MRYRHFFFIICALICVTFTALAAKPHRALKIQINGITGDAKKNADLTLENFKSKLQQPLKQLSVYHFMSRAPSLLKDAIAPYGYFQPSINKELIKTNQGWQAIFNVAKGDPTIVTAVNITVTGPGENEHFFTSFLNKLPLKEGDILKTEEFEKIKSELYSIATRHGFFDAKMPKHELKIDLSKHSAQITITLKTGSRYRFGKITFTKSVFSEKFLESFLAFKNGDYYNSKKLEKTQESLINSNYFNQVLIKPESHSSKGHLVPIHIKLIPRKKNQYIAGLGYGSDTGIRGTAGLTIRHIGNWGQRLQTLLRASEDNSSVTAKYFIPGLNPAKDLFTIGSGYNNINQANGAAKSLNASLGYTRKFNGWSAGIALTYLKERYNIANIPRTETELVYPTLSVGYLKTDHHLNPTYGLRFTTYIAAANSNVLSKTDFIQIRSKLNTLYTIDYTHTRLLFRTEAGYTNIKHLGNLPLSLQLQAGGARSVRGYAYNEIGPARNLLVLSQEIQQKIYKEWYLVGFVDAAAIGDKQILSDVVWGTGPGIAWVSSVGTLELTLANAINKTKNPWMIQFTMGSVL